MLNNMMNIINNLEETEIERLSNITKNDINEFGFILFKNYDLLQCYGLNIAMLCNPIIDGKQVPMIVVDGNFDELSDEAKIFTIAHELGHVNYHLNKYNDPNNVRNINDEFEADSYAVQLLGPENSINSLKQLKSYLIDELWFDEDDESIQEIERRINNLKQLSHNI